MFLFALPIQILFSIFISVHFALSTVNPPPISAHTRPADAAQINQIKVELFDSLSALLAEFSGFAVAAGRKSEENAIQWRTNTGADKGQTRSRTASNSHT